MRGAKQLITLQIPVELLEDSIQILKSSPDKEKVILWLGQRVNDSYLVEEVFTPIQITEADYFHIPESAMDELMARLRNSRRMLVSQVHTHPFEAFHSAADDRWAIVRHVGAYSLVLPEFCAKTQRRNFIRTVASFVLNDANKWKKVSNKNIIIL